MTATRWGAAVDGGGGTRWRLAVGVDAVGVEVLVPLSRTVAESLAPEIQGGVGALIQAPTSWTDTEPLLPSISAPAGADLRVPVAWTEARALVPVVGVEEEVPPVPGGVAFALWDAPEETWRVIRLDPAGHRTQLEPQAVETSRGVLGIVRSSITTIRGHLRTWELQAVEMWAEDADAVEEMLLPQLPLIAGGSIVDGQVEVVPGPPQKAIGRTTLYARISVVLYEAAPAHLEA
jgi:hypothetical protein